MGGAIKPFVVVVIVIVVVTGSLLYYFFFLGGGAAVSACHHYREVWPSCVHPNPSPFFSFFAGTCL